MSYKDGFSAINLEMPDRVPRTEYSADSHWDLLRKVTGVNVFCDSDKKVKEEAQKLFYKEWNYDFFWSTYLHGFIFDKKKANMGHAVYQADGSDFDDKLFCPFDNPDEIIKLDFEELYGTTDKKAWIDIFNNDYKNSSEFHPDGVNMTGVYITCISGLIEILGWDMLLLTAGIDPQGFGELTSRYCRYMKPYFEALAECISPVIMVHDDIVWTEGPFINPEWYRKFVFPNYKKMFQPLIENGKKIIFTSDGNYTQFIDDIANCNINGFVLEPTTDMQYIAEKYGKTHAFIGNADTRILTYGTKDDIYYEVKRCIDIGKKCPGFFMAVGNHIPPNTPVDNALYYNEFYEKLSKR